MNPFEHQKMIKDQIAKSYSNADELSKGGVGSGRRELNDHEKEQVTNEYNALHRAGTPVHHIKSRIKKWHDTDLHSHIESHIDELHKNRVRLK